MTTEKLKLAREALEKIATTSVYAPCYDVQQTASEAFAAIAAESAPAAPVGDGDERALTEQQAADIVRKSGVLTDFGMSSILNGDPVEFILPELAKILRAALTQQKE